MRVFAYAMGFSAMKAHDVQQQSIVDATLRMVDRSLAHQQNLRQAIRDGRVRVDTMVDDALVAARPDGAPKQ